MGRLAPSILNVTTRSVRDAGVIPSDSPGHAEAYKRVHRQWVNGVNVLRPGEVDSRLRLPSKNAQVATGQ